MQLLRPENKDFGTKWFLYDMGLSLAGKGLLTTIMMFPEKICLTDSMFFIEYVVIQKKLLIRFLRN